MLLAAVISQVFPDFDRADYPDWETLFRALNYRTGKRFTLCLDEFPYMAEQSPELPSVLQKLIDAKMLKFNLVLCGSSMSMMYGMFLDSTAPLYGRADEIMRLSPLRLPYLKEALRLDSISAVEEYAVWGGVPRYWELRERCDSLDDALKHYVFSPEGSLYEEPAKIFRDDVKDIVKTSTIMSYIGMGANRLSEIASRCGTPATSLSRPLKKLLDLGYLTRELPFGSDESNAKKSLYKIADPFLSFYHRFVVPNRSFIELGRISTVERLLAAHFTEHIGMQWEKLCRDAITGNELNGVLFGRAQRWWGHVLNEEGKPEQMEFDVVAESMEGKLLLVGECKWSREDNISRLLAELSRKARLLPFANGREVVPVLFLKSTAASESAEVIGPDEVLKMLE